MLSNEIHDVVFYTRFGIGVSDRRWMDYRIALFEAVTLPSIARFCAQGAQWFIFTDLWMDLERQTRMEQALRRVEGSENIRLVPLPLAAYLAPTLGQFVRDRDQVSLVRIDDDDALSSSYFDLVPSGPGLVTVAGGLEALLSERTMRPMDHPYHSMNTVFTGPPEQAAEFARVGHHRIEEWGKKVKARITVVEKKAPGFLYARHKLADSGFGSIRHTIVTDDASTPLTDGWRRRFGIDEELFQNWRALDRATPPLSEAKTWLRGGELLDEAQRITQDMATVHAGIRESTADLLADQKGGAPAPQAQQTPTLTGRARSFLRRTRDR